MIVSFGDKNTQKIWEGRRVKSMATELQEKARRKLRMLNNSQNLMDLMVPPSNKLEKLYGNLKEYYSIRINEQWRILFLWKAGNTTGVKITDYH